MKRERVPILGNETISVGFSYPEQMAADIVGMVKASTFVIVTDSNIAPLHLANLVRNLQEAIDREKTSARILPYVIPPGESVKTREMKASIEDWMLSKKVTRDSCMVALGGGVIGDMMGQYLIPFYLFNLIFT